MTLFGSNKAAPFRLQQHNDRAQHAGHRTKQAKQEEKRSSHMVATRIWYLINNAVGHHTSKEQRLDIGDPELGNADVDFLYSFIFNFLAAYISMLTAFQLSTYCVL